MDAIALLQTQHAEVEALFEKLADRPSDADWHELLGRLADRLMLHAALEEEIFYPAVAAIDGELVAHARDEHRAMERSLETLRDPHPEKAATLACLHELRRTVQHHVAEEETEMMRQAERLGASELRELGRRMEERIQVGELEHRKVAAR